MLLCSATSERDSDGDGLVDSIDMDDNDNGIFDILDNDDDGDGIFDFNEDDDGDGLSNFGDYLPSAVLQGDFFNWYPPKKLKYVKPKLGVSTLR